MAIIQLKKVVNLNPKFVRANQLLALLYMMTGKRDNKVRAKKLLTNISKVDVTNTTTIRYLKELSDVQVKGEQVPKKVTAQEPEPRKMLPRVEADAYKPITPYKEEKPSIMPFINIIVGVLIGMALMGFVIIPHIQSNKSNKENSEFKKYSEQKASSDSDVTTLKNEKQKLEEEIKSLKEENEALTGDGTGDGSTLLMSYENLLAAIESHTAGDKITAAKKLVKVNEELLTGSKAKKVYEDIKEDTFGETSKSYFEQGRDAYNGEGEYAGRKDYDKAIKLLQKSLDFDPDNTDSLYFMGRCYQQKSDAEKAKEYYNKIVDEYPQSSRVGEANRRLRELGE